MNSLVLAAALTAPAQPPAFPPPVAVAPGVRLQPQVVPLPAFRPPVGVPVFQPQPFPVPAPPAVTLGDFSRFFTPTPGRHHVWVVHPVTRQPVEVCFTLPPGQLKQFKVERREIRFEFRGGFEVEIEFRNNGTVKVEYDD